MVLGVGSAWAGDKTVVKYSFDDSTSPSLTAGSRVGFDYDKTSVITSTKFLNAFNNANGDPGASTLSLGDTDLSGETWTLSFEWAACGGCNSKADHTTLKAGDTNLFDLTGNSNWNTTVTITYTGSDGTKTLPVPGCNKSYRFSAAVGNQMNTTDYWHHIVVTGGDDGVKMTITNSNTGTAVVEDVVLSETNVNPTSLIIEPCCGGGIGIDELSLTYYVEGEVIQTPTAAYTAVNGIERTITATCETEGVTIQYSTDGTNWTDGAEVTVSASGNVYFKAVKGTSESDVLTFAAEAGEAITLNAPAIVRSDNTTVTITADQSNLLLSPTATIKYTYGDEAGEFTGSKTLTVAADATITAYAEATGYTTSETSERAVALFPVEVKQIENTASKTSGWSSNAFSEDTKTVSERTYAALLLDETQWGKNIYLQTEGAHWGLRSTGNWYIDSNLEESWMLMPDMKKGDIIVANVTYPASSMVNATYSKYSFGTQHAYEVTEDGNVELAFKKISASEMDYLYGVYAYTQAGEKSILTLKGTVGEEVSLTFGVYDTEDEYSVDFGDGKLVTKKVGVNNAGPVDPESGQTTSATVFTGTVGTDGIIKVYGNNDVWYLVTNGGAVPTTFDQAKLMNVVQMSITGSSLENVALPAYTKMTQFSFNNSAVKTLDVSNVTTLTSLTVNNTSASQYAPQLESIDLSKNTELTYLSLQGNQNNYGKLTSLDLSNNKKLQGMGLYVQYNQLESLTLPTEWAPDEVTETQTITYGLTTINVQNNKLTTLNTANLKKMKQIYAADNQLTSIDVSGMESLAWFDVKNNQLAGDLDLTANKKLTNVYVNNNQLTSVKVDNVTKQFYVDGNKLTLATIPAQPAGMNTSSKTNQFHYAPQAAMEVSATVHVLDLSAQATVAKGELNPEAVGEAAAYTTWLENKATVFTVKTAGETPATLVEGTDYTNAGGKITFLKSQAEKVYVEMTNEALPKFTGANVFKTTEFTVVVPEDIEIAAADITGGDITAALATATEGKLVKNITINLAAETKYTVSAAIEVPAGLTINGNGATIDASALEGNMIQWINIDEAQTWTNADVAITAVTVKGLKKALFYSNSKYYYGNFTLINSFIEQAADATTFDYTKGSVALNFTIAGSTIYAPTATTKSLYSSQSGQKAIEYNADATQNFVISVNTMYNLAPGKNFFTHRQNSQKWLSYTVQNNLFVNCGKSGQVIKGLNGGSSSVNPTWTIKGNAFNFDGADTSANEETGDADHTQDETPGLNETVQDNVAGVMTFTNVETPDFGGTFEMPFGATAPEALGDNRWTITFTNAPAPLYIIGGPKEWKLDDMTEMTYNATTQAYEYEYAPTSVAYFAISDVATAESWDDFNANHRYAIGESDKEVTLNEAIALQKVNGTIVLKPVKEGTTYKISIAKDLSTITISGEAAPEPTEDTYVVAGNNVDLFGEAWNGTYEANTMTLNETSGLYEKTYTNVALKTGTIEYKIVKNGSAWYPGENQKCEIAADGTYDVVVTFDAVKLEATMVATVATGINSIAADKMKDATIFTIGGQRVEKAQKGLYIINGKKVVIK